MRGMQKTSVGAMKPPRLEPPKLKKPVLEAPKLPKPPVDEEGSAKWDAKVTGSVGATKGKGAAKAPKSQKAKEAANAPKK